MAEWLTVEVLDGEEPASCWRSSSTTTSSSGPGRCPPSGPRRPRPHPVAGAATLPPPEPDLPVHLGSEPPARDDDPGDVEPVRG
ncbi:hypothetical protein [Geodermatophilus sp. SYSU D00700]